jgi:hypothetical protein
MIENILKEHLEGKPHRTKCLVGKWLLTEDKQTNEMFEKLKEKPNLNVSGLYMDLQPYKLTFQLTTFKTHMKGTCTCPKI